MKKLTQLFFFTLACCFFSLSQGHAIVIDSGTIDADLSNSTGQNLVQVAETLPDLQTFTKALNASGLNASLQEKGPYTIFAPSDAAFASLPAKRLDELMKNPTALAALLKNHIVNGSISSINIQAGNMNSIGGKPLHIEIRGSQITVDNANIIQADIAASNGYIQVIDTVLE